MSAHDPTCVRLRLPPRGPRGFTLIELMIACAIGASLLVTLAATAQLFSEQLTEVSADTDARLQQTAATLTRGTRQAWAVEVPAGDRLVLQDPLGNVTEYFQEDDALKVLRPSGVEGVVMSGLESFTLTPRTMARLRDDEPMDLVQTCWTAPSAGTAGTLTLIGGQSVAIGFTLPAATDGSFDTVDGVAEQMQTTQLSRLVLPVGWLDGSNKQFCHLHATPPHTPTHPGGQGIVTLELYEARAPGDARPIGPLLASTVLTAGMLPSAPYYWWDRVQNKVVTPPTGVAWGWWDWFQDNWQVVLVVQTTMTTAPLDLGGLHAALEPSRAYTLVLSVAGYDQITLQTHALASSKLSGTALQSTVGGTWVPQALAISCSLEGHQTISQTRLDEVVAGVEFTLETTDGQSLTGSVNVAGQVAVTEPWLGVVPGEEAVLESGP